MKLKIGMLVEQYFPKHRFLDICRCAFNFLGINKFALIRLILDVKCGDDPLSNLLKIIPTFLRSTLESPFFIFDITQNLGTKPLGIALKFNFYY